MIHEAAPLNRHNWFPLPSTQPKPERQLQEIPIYRVQKPVVGSVVYDRQSTLLLVLVVATAAMARQNVETVKNNFIFFIKFCL